MKKIVSCVCVAIVFLMAAGCAKKGFDRGALRENMYSEKVVTDSEINRILSLKPQIKFPFKLGVYFSGADYWRYGPAKWDKDEQDVEWLNQLKKDNIVSDVIYISPSTVSSGYDREDFLKIIRLAAARHNVDAVLIIDYSCAVDRYNNYSAFLYLTIIGGYFVPGTHSDALVIMNAALWDVRNEYLYLTVDTESMAENIGPAFILEDKESANEAKDKALDEIKAEVIMRIRNLKGY